MEKKIELFKMAVSMTIEEKTDENSFPMRVWYHYRRLSNAFDLLDCKTPQELTKRIETDKNAPRSTSGAVR